MTSSWAIAGVDLHLDLMGGRIRVAVERALRDAVRGGRLAPGTRLPSSRVLAVDLGISRNTVAEAYTQLVSEGWLVGRPGSGTTVADPAPGGPRVTSPDPAGQPGHAWRLDLTAGAPDVSAFPRSAWLAAARRALGRTPAEALGYGDPRGLPVLRAALADYLARVRGVSVASERLVICGGFTQGLDLVSQVLLARGVTRIAVEGYGYAAHRAALTRHGLAVLPLPVDDAGARVDDVDGAGAMLLTPAHQFPLGSVLAAERRRRAVAWALRADGFIVEDDYDGEFRYDRQPVGAMQSLAPDRIIYAGTASKTLAPGLRLGWLVLPAGMVEEVTVIQAMSGAQHSAVDQLTLTELLVSGGYDRHVRRSRLTYRRRRDQLVAALGERLPAARVTGVAAGLHLLVQLPERLDEASVVAGAAARGLLLQGLSEFAAGPGEHGPALVVGYGRPPDHDYSAAIDVLLDTLVRVS